MEPASPPPEPREIYAFANTRTDENSVIPTGLLGVEMVEWYELGSFATLVTQNITRLRDRFPKPVETGNSIPMQIEASRQNLKALCGTELVDILEKELMVFTSFNNRVEKLKDINMPGVKRKETWLKLKECHKKEIILALITCFHIGKLVSSAIPSYQMGFVNSSNLSGSINISFDSPAKLYDRLAGELTKASGVCKQFILFEKNLAEYTNLIKTSLEWIKKNPDSQI